MVFYPFLGWSIFWIGLIVAIILFSLKRKWYPIMYLISVCLYIFTVGFVIDVFNFDKNGTLLSLAFSAVIMLGMGYYLSTKFKK